VAILSRVRRSGRFSAAVLLALALLAAGPAAAAGIGQRAPEFTLPDSHGHPIALVDGTGRVVVVDFWASWCIPCAPMLPALDALAQRHSGKLRVLAIDIDQSRAKGDAFLHEYLPDPSSAMTILADPAGDVLSRYGAGGMPAAFVIDAGGTVRFTADGYSEEHMRDLENAVRALLPADAGASSSAASPPRAVNGR
jgi:thiol-disulfide isomerase/thioredoxin